MLKFENNSHLIWKIYTIAIYLKKYSVTYVYERDSMMEYSKLNNI
jgi:hypothetical protein